MQDFLSIFGLDLSEIEIFLKLFEFKNSTAKDLEKITDISKGKVYSILNILLEKGLVQEERGEGKTKYYNAVNPDKLVELRNKLIKQIELENGFSISE